MSTNWASLLSSRCILMEKCYMYFLLNPPIQSVDIEESLHLHIKRCGFLVFNNMAKVRATVSWTIFIQILFGFILKINNLKNQHSSVKRLARFNALPLLRLSLFNVAWKGSKLKIGTVPALQLIRDKNYFVKTVSNVFSSLAALKNCSSSF